MGGAPKEEAYCFVEVRWSWRLTGIHHSRKDYEQQEVEDMEVASQRLNHILEYFAFANFGDLLREVPYEWRKAKACFWVLGEVSRGPTFPEKFFEAKDLISDIGRFN